jgi:CBS-domain-containing membrane protein
MLGMVVAMAAQEVHYQLAVHGPAGAVALGDILEQAAKAAQ